MLHASHSYLRLVLMNISARMIGCTRCPKASRPGLLPLDLAYPSANSVRYQQNSKETAFGQWPADFVPPAAESEHPHLLVATPVIVLGLGMEALS